MFVLVKVKFLKKSTTITARVITAATLAITKQRTRQNDHITIDICYMAEILTSV